MTIRTARLQSALVIRQGATFDRTILIRYKASGLPYDLTGKVGRMQGRATIDSVDKVFDLTTENGGLTFHGITGLIDVHMPAAGVNGTGGMPARLSGYTDLEIVTPGGDGADTNLEHVDRAIEGRFYVNPGATR